LGNNLEKLLCSNKTNTNTSTSIYTYIFMVVAPSKRREINHDLKEYVLNFKEVK
jgi:hypothetical protein